jgi:succinoglycan biosynthesis transport protein ExoP
LDLRQYLRLLQAHWAVIAVSIVVCAVGAGLLAWSRAPVYTARTQLFVSTGGAATDLGQTYQGGLFSQQRVRSYAQIMSSPLVMKAVIDELRLPDSVGALQGRIRTSVPADTVLINVTVEDQSPQRAKAIADAVGARFPEFVNTLETSPRERASPVKVTVTSPAELPTSATAPSKRLYLALGVLLGLVLGIAVAVPREVFDRRITDDDDAAAIVGAPVLGNIARDKHAHSEPLVVDDDPFSPRAEAYRRLRTNLRALSVDNNLKSFVVTSAVAHEGKTLIVANLGVAFAQAGYRVILVDADLRRPQLAEMLGLSSTQGLTNVLEGELSVDAALQTWRDGLPLRVLGSGPTPSNPSEMLGSERFAGVLSLLADSADVVLLDASALLPVTDAVILARMTSGLILVTRVGSTRADQVEEALQSLRAVDEHVLGVVMNRHRARRTPRRRSTGYSNVRGPDPLELDEPLRVPAGKEG